MHDVGRTVADACRGRRPAKLPAVAWNDGCLPRPAVGEGARAVEFPWEAADALGAALADGRTAVADNLAARSVAERRFLGDWQGGHQREFAGERAQLEAVLTADSLGSALSTLRAAWDDAAARQAAENGSAAATADPPCG